MGWLFLFAFFLLPGFRRVVLGGALALLLLVVALSQGSMGRTRPAEINSPAAPVARILILTPYPAPPDPDLLYDLVPLGK